METDLLERAVKTEGEMYDTGLRLRGFEVHARPPHHYRHYTEFLLTHPQVFETEVYRDGEFLGEPRWVVGFTRPDGVRQVTYSSYKTEEEAEHARTTYRGATHARLCYSFAVGYKAGARHATKEDGRPWGTVLADDEAYQPMRFELTEEEAAAVLAFREEVDAEWERRSADYLRRDRERTEAIALAAALDDLPASVLNALGGPTHCLECGAEFEEPGHVRSHGMGCDRCDH